MHACLNHFKWNYYVWQLNFHTTIIIVSIDICHWNGSGHKCIFYLCDSIIRLITCFINFMKWHILCEVLIYLLKQFAMTKISVDIGNKNKKKKSNLRFIDCDKQKKTLKIDFVWNILWKSNSENERERENLRKNGTYWDLSFCLKGVFLLRKSYHVFPALSIHVSIYKSIHFCHLWFTWNIIIVKWTNAKLPISIFSSVSLGCNSKQSGTTFNFHLIIMCVDYYWHTHRLAYCYIYPHIDGSFLAWDSFACQCNAFSF